MIVAVSADNLGPHPAVAPDFGRSSLFLLYDTEGNERRVLENPYADSLGDAGIQSARLLIEKDVGALITDGIGRNALRVLSAGGVSVFRCGTCTVSEAIVLFSQDKLTKLFSIPPANPLKLRGRRRKRLSGRR